MSKIEALIINHFLADWADNTPLYRGKIKPFVDKLIELCAVEADTVASEYCEWKSDRPFCEAPSELAVVIANRIRQLKANN